jgi:hypothetical protein
MQINYDTKTVTFGNGMTDQLIADKFRPEVTATLLYKEQISNGRSTCLSKNQRTL